MTQGNLNRSRVYTPDEVRDLFLNYVWHLIDYWDENGDGKRNALEGLAHSILATLDGESAELPGFHVLPIGTLEDQEFFREQGRNWFPLCRLQNDYDIGGSLHNRFFRVQPRDVPEEELNLRKAGLSDDEAKAVYRLCVSTAANAALSVADLADMTIRTVLNVPEYKERLLKIAMPSEKEKLVITSRELKEIDHALYYALECAHGTTGHNQLMLIAKMAKHLGFIKLPISTQVPMGGSVIVDDGPATRMGNAA